MKIVILQPLAIDKSQLDVFIKTLSDKGHELTSFDTLPKDKKEAIERAKNAEILMLVNYPFDKESIKSCPNIKMISVAFTGFDHVDTEECKKRNIVVCNAAGYATNSVAELTFGLIISLLRNIPKCNEVIRVGGTRQGLIGNDLYGKTLGIVGTGTIGLRVAEIGKAFGCKLLGYSHSERKEATQLGLKYTDLKTLLSGSDIITVHSPLNSETKDLISWDEFKLVKSTVFVIQTSRGGTINKEAFTDALNTKKIAGGGIDVFVQEPPVSLDNQLLKTTNSVMSPHVAFATKEALVRRAEIAFNNVSGWINGKVQNKVC
ncbi:MAG: Lactate dehydrogenase-like protein dehydrogenase [Candidatus Roizmanbacteria bacterium GW2011_GWC2_37_13]|uniref:Lactate dehydrogenase-like protein dehydrogenase n=1 Tax=Candidatus Roizmanbacteria bacterium GW2011_GWC2_37_13 TaxID=1618486 RepID=A0A0G0GD15_9BACT|nr:MAG: Lactate dehydrogenase-like protein dehydrogenase [Candidatus Roizmanbacteria bacterium GW2011_GWC2_37_13]KKQ24543.1 MAG: Lactate dehydrogenase-like protein dehydrogenase [Candidatus Roizmanbacteria bacterium GW2011_GWC1_37_12]